MGEITKEQIFNQSKNAIAQWGEQWRKHSTYHKKYDMKPLEDFLGSGVGRPVLVVANGYSFEEEIEKIKLHRDNVDVFACDKTIGHLLDNGIKPDFCMICDANVSYEKYLAPYADQLDETILFQNVCGNPDWTDKGNWKDRYFFVNKDVLSSEKEFGRLSGCTNYIPAGTNVSNAMVIMLTQCDNDQRINFFGYDKLLLIGFDYCWQSDKSYYAFNKDGGGKENYMRHVYCVNMLGESCYSSSNLLFSAKWLDKYIAVFDLPVVQCTKRSILETKYKGEISEQMSYHFKRQDSSVVQNIGKTRRELVKKIKELDLTIKRIGSNHYYNFISTV